ncbi:MAG TPA: hypothetical protein VII24_02880 [Pseudolabrys sp.]|jgi:hypothetical protein
MELLHHYTNRAGLEGIARTKSLWATNFLDLKDTREILYGLVELLKLSLKSAMAEVPADKKQRSYTDADLAQIEEKFYSHIRTVACQADDGHLYVTSFAAAKTPDHDRRGIRSLWKDIGEDGYCLQFSKDDIEMLVQREDRLFNYGLIQASSVSYGLDKSSSDYGPLQSQMVQRLLCFIATARPDVGVELQHERLWPETTFVGKLMQFCARHKDPYFEDQREFRILAIPANTAASRPFTGIAVKKRPHLPPSGKRYIDIGEGWERGIEPRQILVGPCASRNLQDVLNSFSCLPEIIYVDVPEYPEQAS